MQLGKIHGINKRGKYVNNWGVVHQRYIAVWDNRMVQRPQIDISSYLEPLLKYIQWYSSKGKPYLLGGQSTVVPPHMHRLRAYEPVPDIEAEPEPEPELEPELEPKPEQLYTNSANSSYHPELRVNDYFPGLSGHGYHSGFDIFSPVPL
ncbi:hypothetical protein PVK06_024731 [Gossypium arboreum]|uniref:Uncharacterized protein n=1 Tax=Gossypium arboreum TaxID=29729 RepID=A0ABR0PEN9_GOSAR|nr:hypothetical protein PVK06_024731 [Gossypium arboreum]